MTDTALPRIRLRRNKSSQPLRFGAPWAFADTLVLDRRTRAIPSGDIVMLEDADGQPIGTGAFNASSKIAFRMLDLAPGCRIDDAWIAARISTALEMRETLYPDPFYRLIHAEADGMPGVIIDRFGEACVIQPNAAWAERRLDGIVTALKAVAGARVIVKNASGRARKLEGLDDQSLVIEGALDGPIDVPMNGATYRADLIGGQKTGLFYDQRPNHAFAARLAPRRRVLDVFSHVGGFALATLARGAASALAVDASQPALDLASEGAAASDVADHFTTLRGDAFEVMEALAKDQQRFGLVICDPPAFAPAKPALEAGLRAYERAARLAAQLVEPGGYLVLCSCSHAAGLDKFRAASLRGIGKAGRAARILHTGGAGPDHPTHPYLAETAYLKALFLRLVE